jgi:SAM-dependent methyltransferase
VAFSHVVCRPIAAHTLSLTARGALRHNPTYSMTSAPPYFERLAAAFVRGKTDPASVPEATRLLLDRPLADLSPEELRQLIDLGLERELRLHAFKNSRGLPRVSRVLGIVRSFHPASQLDIGSGRGVFLWPLLNEFPELSVTTVDRLEHRVKAIQAVIRGGMPNLTTLEADTTSLPFPDQSFDLVTMLEVLEHIPDAGRALAEACRVASRGVVLSVPSKSDDNPEHIHLFNRDKLRALFQRAGIQQVNFDYVLNHLIAVATREPA